MKLVHFLFTKISLKLLDIKKNLIGKKFLN
jgi:hypothetical protein